MSECTSCGTEQGMLFKWRLVARVEKCGCGHDVKPVYSDEKSLCFNCFGAHVRGMKKEESREYPSPV